MKYQLITLLLLLSIGSLQVSAGDDVSQSKTIQLDGNTSPPANIDDVHWLVGAWTGDAFGSKFEEVWNPPSAGSMVGMFKVFDEQQGVIFYELMLIVEEEGSLNFKVKHFNADFTGWESKDDYVNFPLVKIEENAIHFGGLSFYRKNENEMTAYVAIKQKDGSIKEEKLSYFK